MQDVGKFGDRRSVPLNNYYLSAPSEAHRALPKLPFVKPWLRLILVFSNDSELHAEGVQDGVDGFEAWVCACAQGFVQALPAQS